jgi:hypothetical protein
MAEKTDLMPCEFADTELGRLMQENYRQQLEARQEYRKQMERREFGNCQEDRENCLKNLDVSINFGQSEKAT